MYNFNYYAPSCLKECEKIYFKSEAPKYLAGGMTLIPAMKQKLSSPSDLIDLTNILDLKGIELKNKELIRIGSMTTHNEVAGSDVIKHFLPGLSFLAKNIADNAVRNKGTIGGSICNADPAADYPAALISLDANVITNLKSIKAKNFFVEMFETSLQDGELVTAIDFPIASHTYYKKFSSLASRYAIVGVFLTLKEKEIKVCITGAANRPFLIDELNSKNLKEINDINFQELNFEKYDINSDINASKDYKISLIKSLTQQIINSLKVYE